MIQDDLAREEELEATYAPGKLKQMDPTFEKDWAGSHPAVWVVAHWLWSRGNRVTIPAPRLRPTSAERLEYSDPGDIILETGTIEVKHRKVDFDSIESFPFPTVFLDRTHRLPGLVVALFIVSRDMKSALIFDVEKTEDHWIQEQTVRGTKEYLVYSCPPDKATFRRLR